MMRAFWFISTVLLATSASAQDFVKCGTPQVIEAMRMGKMRATDSDLRTSATHSTLSPSGKFRLNYDIAGFHAVPTADLNANGIPDYIERAGEYADESWRILVDSLGFVDPVVPGSPYRIDFLSVSYYGETRSAGSTSYIIVHSTFNGFPANDDPDGNQLGALKVTIAHELKHAIQYATNRWSGEAGNSNWTEMDATMIEEVVYPQVNDYVTYTRSGSIFRNPGLGIPRPYTHASWMLYYHERLGPRFWTEVWNRIRANWTIPMFTAMRAADPLFAPLFEEHATANHMWHFASGTRGTTTYGFADRAKFPTAASTSLTSATDVALIGLAARAARYYRYAPTAADTGEVRLIVHRRHPDFHVGLVLFLHDGSVQERLVVRRGGAFPESVVPPYELLRTGIRFEDVALVGIVAVNTGSVPADGRFGVGNANRLATMRYGDFNADGVLDGRDLTDFSAYLLGKMPLPTAISTPFRSDLNLDGFLSPVDAGRLFRGEFPSDRNVFGLGPGASRFPPAVVPFDQPFNLIGHGLDCANGLTLPTVFVPEFIADGDTLKAHLTSSVADPLGRRDWFGRLAYPDTVLALLSVGTDDVGLSDQYSDWMHENGQSTFLHFRKEADDWSARVTFTFRVMRPQSFRLGFLGGEIAPCVGFAPTHVDLLTNPKTPVGLDSRPGIASRIGLDAPYPNPFNPKTVIGFQVPGDHWGIPVRLAVHDLLGREVAVLVDGRLPSGSHQAVFDGAGVASGVYLIVLDAGGERHVRSATLLK